MDGPCRNGGGRRQLSSLDSIHSIHAAGPTDTRSIAELWNEPAPGQDLSSGFGGRALSPDPTAKYTVIAVKKGGFSEGYTVVDPRKRERSVKFRPEALTEVVSSRILRGIGYHQPPIYLLEKRTAESATSPNPQPAARFREGAEAGRPGRRRP